MNDNTITFYYYTAWDGFAWQGCDEATANSLQLYMEATKTLPKSSTDRPPFGGARVCPAGCGVRRLREAPRLAAACRDAGRGA